MRVPNEESAEYPKEFSALDPELILREVPGKSVQWATNAKRRNRRWLRRALLDPPRRKVIRMG